MEQVFIYPDLSPWWKNAIHTKSGVVFAPEDFYLLDEQGRRKEFFTWDEALDIEKKILRPNGWRLPTINDWAKAVIEFKKSKYMRLKLNLGLNGFIWWGEVDMYNMNLDMAVPGFQGMYGYYWSSTKYSKYRIYNMHVSTSKIRLVHGSYSDYGNSIRCVAL